MLDWLSSKLRRNDNPDHPLGDQARVDAYVDSLRQREPQRILMEMNQWLADPARLLDELPPALACYALSQLDELGESAVQRYWSTTIREAEAERRGLMGSNTLQTQISNSLAANYLCMKTLAGLGDKADRQLLARVALRAMRQWTDSKKLARMTYREINPDYWRHGHGLLREIHGQGLTNQAITAYTGDTGASSPWREFMVAQLMETVPCGNLSVGELEAADRVVRWLEPQCRLSTVPEEGLPFAIPPGQGPLRLRKDLPPPTGARFFGLGKGYAALQQLRDTMARENRQPNWLTSAGCSPHRNLALIDTLLLFWSDNPPRRNHERKAVQGNILVVCGAAAARRVVEAADKVRAGLPPNSPPNHTPLGELRYLENQGEKLTMDNWEVLDMSQQGLGVGFAARRPWHCVGALVAFRQEKDTNWRLAVIRRLGSSHGRPNAGLKLLGSIPTCAHIRLAAGASAGIWTQQTVIDAKSGWKEAILVSAKANLLLIPVGYFQTDLPVHIAVGEQWKPGSLVSLVERGEDFEVVEFRLSANNRYA